MTTIHTRSHATDNPIWGAQAREYIAECQRILATGSGGDRSESVTAPDQPWPTDSDADRIGAREENLQARQWEGFER